jgi:predicted nucleotidyltransferase
MVQNLDRDGLVLQASVNWTSPFDSTCATQCDKMHPMVASNVSIPIAALESICKRYRVFELSIFGSALRDDFRPDSDIDLLVQFEPSAQIGFLALAALQRELSELAGRKVDLIPKAGLKPLIRDSILSSARVLYHAA